MGNNDDAKREVSANELGQIKDKYPQMAQKFEGVKKEAFKPQVERLGETKGEQYQRTQGQ